MDDQDKNSPLVSMGLVVYNRAHYLPKLLDCLLAQTFGDFELIISDDASPDKEVQKICEEYAKKDKRIRYFRQKTNLNVPPNFKFVLERAIGKYFMWVQDDDLYDKRFIEDCLAVFGKDHELVMVFADMVDIDKNGSVFKHLDPAKYLPLSRDTYERLKKFMLFRFGDGRSQLMCGLWKREVILDNPLFGPGAKDDRPPFYWGFETYFIFRNLAKGPVGFVPQTRFFRRHVLDRYPLTPPRRFLPRMFLTLYHRLEKIFCSPYFWYIMRRIAVIRGLSLWQRLRLEFWNLYVMARLFFARET